MGTRLNGIYLLCLPCGTSSMPGQQPPALFYRATRTLGMDWARPATRLAAMPLSPDAGFCNTLTPMVQISSFYVVSLLAENAMGVVV